MRLKLLLLQLVVFAQHDISDQLNTIFDQDGERQEKLDSLKDRINNLDGMDENYHEYYKHLTAEKLAFVMKQNKVIEEKTKRLRKLMQDYLADVDDVVTNDEL